MGRTFVYVNPLPRKNQLRYVKKPLSKIQKMSKEEVLLDEKQKKGDYWFNMYQNRPEYGCLAIPLSEYVCDDSASESDDDAEEHEWRLSAIARRVSEIVELDAGLQGTQ